MSAPIDPATVRDWIALSLAHGIGPSSFHRLVGRLGSPSRVLAAARSKLGSLPGLESGTQAGLANPAGLREMAEREMGALAKIGGRPLILEDPDYPGLLRSVPQPPPVIYVLGRGELLGRDTVAMVGSRAATSYGRRASRTIAQGLARAGVGVASGLAAGIDAEAHDGALSQGGATVAVLGCGLDVVYPRQNRRLYERIREDGALVSEYPLGTAPEAFRFPARNRIIAGLSRAVVVVEASKRSGSLITVRYALEAGREVFAVPGQIDSLKSAGTHWLVQQGAALAVSAEDILEQLRWQTVGAGPRQDVEGAGLPELDGDWARLLALVEPYPQSREELLRRAGWPAAHLNEVLLMLELEGLVEMGPGDLVRKVAERP